MFGSEHGYLIKTKTLWRQIPDIVKATAILVAILTVFAYPVFFQGKQFSPMDLLYPLPPWKGFAPDWFEQQSNGLRWDDATKFYPERINLIRNFRQDGMTFWQTDHLSGTPNRPTLQRYGLLVYPLMWLFSFLPFNTANSLIHILNLLIAGLSMWLLLREHRLGRIPSLLGAIVYMLNGFFIAWMSAFFLPAMLALLPLALFLYRRFLSRQKVVFALLLALVTAWQFYLGYPPGSLVFLVYLGLYVLVSLTRLFIQGDYKVAVRTIGILCLLMLLAVGLAAFYLIPTAKQLVGSEYMVNRGQGRYSSIPFEYLLGYLFPNLWGNPTGAMGRIWTGWQNYCEIIAYWGLVPLILAVFGLMVRRRNGQIYLFAILSLIVSISLAYGIQPLVNLRYLPGITGINPTRWQFGVALAGSMLAALGLDQLLASKQEQRARGLLLLSCIASTLAVVVLTVASPADYRAQFADYPRLVWSHYWQIFLATASIVMLALYLWFRKSISANLFGPLMLGLVLVDLIAFGQGFNPYIAEEDLYPTTPGIRFLQSQEEPSRIAPWGSWFGIFPAYTANVYGIQTVTGMDHYRDLTYHAYLEPLMSEDTLRDAARYGYVRLDQNFETQHRLLDMLNVRYIATKPENNPIETLTTVYLGPDMRIYENESVLPHSWGVPRYELISNEQALQRMHEADFDPRHLVLLEQDPKLEMDQSSCRSQDLVSEVVGYAQDEIIVQTDFACNGVLVLSERSAPEWQATVDGESAEVLRANYLLRAVAVPKGQHIIHLRYRPSTYLWGAGVSLFALVLLCGMLGFVWNSWRGAAVVGFVIPATAILAFSQPFNEPMPPSERWVQVDTPDRPSIVPNIQEARLSDVQGEISFLGYEVDKTVLAPGDTFRLTLFWRSEVAVEQGYTVFTHLLDEDQIRWAQKDQPPLGGRAPTSSWREGQFIADTYYLTINPEAPVTVAHLWIGMYDSQTGGRVPLFSLDGSRHENDWLKLDTEISIQQ